MSLLATNTNTNTNTKSENLYNEQQIKKLTNTQLNNQLIELSQKERELTHEILLHINEVESRRLFAQLAYGSTLEYLVKVCHYSESAAYRRIQAARLLKTNPQITEKLQSGDLNISQLAKVQSIIRQHEKQSHQKITIQQKENLLQKIQNQNTHQTDVIIAKELDLKINSQEKIKIQQDESAYVSLNLSKELNEKIKQIKSLISHINPNPSLVEVFEYLTDFYIQKNTPRHRCGVVKNKENFNNIVNNKVGCKEKVNNDKDCKDEVNNDKDCQDEVSNDKRCREKVNNVEYSKVKPNYKNFRTENQISKLTPKIKLQLKQKANFRCQFVDEKTNRKCNSTHQLEIDHIIPRAKGGTDDLKNLRVLCKQHNLLMMERWF